MSTVIIILFFICFGVLFIWTIKETLKQPGWMKEIKKIQNKEDS